MSDRSSGSRSSGSRSSGSRSSGSRSSGRSSSGRSSSGSSKSEVIINFADKINELIFLVKQLNISNKDVKDNIIIEGILKKDYLIELRNIEKEYKEMKKYINSEKAKQKINAKLHGQKYFDRFANKSQQQIFDEYKAMKEEQINEQKFNEEKKMRQKEEREEERKRYREEREREKEELKQRFADIKLQAKKEKEERKRKKLELLGLDNSDPLLKSLSLSSSSSSSSIRRNNLPR
jgi:hypothetical protein